MSAFCPNLLEFSFFLITWKLKYSRKWKTKIEQMFLFYFSVSFYYKCMKSKPLHSLLVSDLQKFILTTWTTHFSFKNDYKGVNIKGASASGNIFILYFFFISLTKISFKHPQIRICTYSCDYTCLNFHLNIYCWLVASQSIIKNISSDNQFT